MRPVWADELRQGKEGRGGEPRAVTTLQPLNRAPRKSVISCSTGLCCFRHTSEAEVYGSHLFTQAQSSVSSSMLHTPLWLRERFQETPSACDLMICSAPHPRDRKDQEWRTGWPGHCREMLGNQRCFGV